MVFYISIIILQFAQTIYQDNNGVKTHYKGAKIVVTLYFFKGPMFELQPSHYYEGFSQCFCKLW
jgi:hypothetical protein